MIEHGKPNPFHLLRASCALSRQEVVDLGRELSDTAHEDVHAASDDEASRIIEERRLMVRWAVEEIITRQDKRLGWEILEVPGAAYGDRKWASFASAHRRPPAAVGQSQSSPPPIFYWTAIVSMAIAGLVDVEPPDVGPALEHAPMSFDAFPPALEVSHVLFG